MGLTHDQAVELVARYGRVQRVIQRAHISKLPQAKLAKLVKKHSTCPRCGKGSASIFGSSALSRRAEVDICEECGIDEALEDLWPSRALSLNDWAICEAPERWGMRMEGGVGGEG